MTKLVKANQFNRSGAVHYRVEQNDKDVGLVTFWIDFERAPEPEHSYVADYFEVHQAEADVIMVFGKTDFPENVLRNKIEVYFPFHAFMHQLWKSTRKLHRKLRETFEEKGKTAKPQGDLESTGIKVQTLTANNTLIVNSGGQCVMDFYLIAARDVWIKTQKNEPLNITAVVRVYVSEQILLGFLNRCSQIADEIRHQLDYPVTEDEDETLEPNEL